MTLMGSSQTSTETKPADQATRQTDPPIIACIDMGTNSFHMIVCRARQDHVNFAVVTRVREAVPFFRRALSQHTIDGPALASAQRILAQMQARAKEHGAERIIAVATSAVRESDNGEQVLQHLRTQLNLDARMISGKEEARLIYLGVLWSMPDLQKRFALVDIGGGSTELITADRTGLYFSESYKLGAARLTARFFKKERPLAHEIRELHDEVKGMLRPASQYIADCGGFEVMLGTSGTVQALAKLDRVLDNRSTEELNGYKLSLERLEILVKYLEDCSLAGSKIHGVSTDRTRTILAGSIVLLESMRSLNTKEIMVCTSALREGVIVDNLLQAGWLEKEYKEHREPRQQSVLGLLHKYQGNQEHAEQVAKLGLLLFEKTKQAKLHNWGEREQHLFWAACMLHDLGMFVSRTGHHKHSFYLIKNGGLLGHSEEEILLIANIARYHRASEPKESHDNYKALSAEDKKLVSELAALLKLAEALDRSHCQVVHRIDLHVEPTAKNKDGRLELLLLIYLVPGNSWEPETWALKQKKNTFERLFQCKLSFEVRMQE